MKILSGMSKEKDASKALNEATTDWKFTPDQVQLILVFHSTSQDSQQIATEISKRFPSVPTIGCSTAGEYLDGKHLNGAMVISAVISPEVKWAVAALPDLAHFTADRATQVATDLTQKLGLTTDSLDPSRHFCIGFMDGLSMQEEAASSILAEAFEGIPFLGGSAGDDLKFKTTYVIANGQSYTAAAAVALGVSSIPFYVMKHQHFLRSQIDLVATEVDPAQRKIMTFDGYPAAQRYAEVLNLEVKDLNSEVFSKFPLTFSCNNEIYVRSILKAEDDGSLRFYCAVEEGMVLEIASHRPMEESLREDVQKLKKTLKTVDWFIGCNCILRSLEATAKSYHESLEQLVLKELSARSIAFDTYGEQLNGLHINQTLVGIAFGEAA